MGEMKLKIMLVLLALLCSSQQVYADTFNDDRISFERYVACFDALENDSELQLIRNKVALVNIKKQTFSMLANENHPTSDETQAIYKWAIKREMCSTNNPLPINNPFTRPWQFSFNAGQSNILELYKGVITYGQFARQRQEIARMAETGHLEIQQQQSQQQQSRQQYQQQQQQQEESLYQACMNRARNEFDKAGCSLERGGRGVGKMIGDGLNR